MLHIVAAEVIDECRYLPLKLYIERFDHIQPAPIGLPCHNPVDIGIVVHTDANRSDRIDISVRLCKWRVAREADSSEAIVPTPLSTIFVPIKPQTSNF